MQKHVGNFEKGIRLTQHTKLIRSGGKRAVLYSDAPTDTRLPPFQACVGCVVQNCICEGEKGYVGNPGIPGLQGSQGFPGDIGEEGPAGPSGIKGSRGDEGSEGTKGDRGKPGVPGFPGAPGILVRHPPPACRVAGFVPDKYRTFWKHVCTFHRYTM